MQTETRITARYAETDQMGIVHHSIYPIWFEAGRTDYLRNAGVSNSEIEAKGIFLPLSHMECTFKSPVRYEDRIVINTRIHKLTCARLEFTYEINDYEGKVLATGNTSHAWTDKSLKPLNIEKKQPELFNILKAALE